ncbi:MAG: T9SS type A sorting domain-containing protein [Cyclobacteriaceae bacterium]|nr:T9SS type A sorting domain-containing protein [Cyclobacteriaceae bacterium]
MSTKNILLGFLLLSFLVSNAQFSYTLDQSIPVEINGKELAMPWAGGINASQVNTMDLNDDGKQDLVLFDRTANKLITFLNQDNQYKYAPDYESLFPNTITQWVLLRDLNCDGKKDLFTSDPFGIIAYINTTKAGAKLSWRPYNPDAQNYPKPILSKGFTIPVNVKINSDDIPAIDDLDGDGDLDMLNFYFIGPGTVEWHQNLAVENSGKCDSLVLQRQSQKWGGFTECACGIVSFQGGKTCDQLINGRAQHNVGKSLLAVDLNNDGDKELFFSEQTCSGLFLLTNEGTPTDALMTQLTPFPAGSPINLLTYPVAYAEDVDFDGVKDLLVSPNISVREYFGTNFQQSVLQFKNTGTAQLPQFTFVKSNFLQADMIDVGDGAVPAFFDYDGDGDQDLFVSNYIKTNGASQVSQFENVGSATAPSFKLVTEDFFTLSILNVINIKIQFVDMNKDGTMDFVFSYTDRRTRKTELAYLANSSAEKLSIKDGTVKSIDFSLAESNNWYVVDINQDGLNDILLGNDLGGVEYWKNSGTGLFELVTDSYLGIGASTERQNVTLTVADLLADGQADLLLANQSGKLFIYENFRKQSTAPAPITSVFYNSLLQKLESRNLGGYAWLAVASIFNTREPSIIVGTTLGGLQILRFEDAAELPDEPQISIYPNPIVRLDEKPIYIRADRSVSVQFYSPLGQKISENYFVPANEDYPINVSALSAGVYIAQFSWRGRIFSKRFIVQ